MCTLPRNPVARGPRPAGGAEVSTYQILKEQHVFIEAGTSKTPLLTGFLAVVGGADRNWTPVMVVSTVRDLSGI